MTDNNKYAPSGSETGDRLRIAIEVVAGVIPNKPEKEFSKQWFIPSDVYYAQGQWEGRQAAAEELMQQYYGHAMEYARSLWNPQRVNWVRMDWIYY